VEKTHKHTKEKLFPYTLTIYTVPTPD